MSIAIVDDNATNLLIIEKILLKVGYTDLVMVSSAKELYQLLDMDSPSTAEVPVDLILMDMMMPEIDGVEACRTVQSHERFKDIPIIFVTAMGDSNKLAEALDAGALDYVMKPINKVELLARICSTLRLKYEKDWHKERDKRIKYELDLAKQVQLSVLSSPIKDEHIEISAVYKPSSELAGDLYAWYPIGPNRYGIILLDMMGHGISSSLVCMYIYSALKDTITNICDPEGVMRELNGRMNQLHKSDNLINYYFTAIYMVLDTEQRTVEYVNAGHPAGIALLDGEFKLLIEGCCAIVFFDSIEITKGVIPYDKQAQIVLFTDGLSEWLELKKASDELEEFSNKLQTSSKYKSDFLANMSHELRTPHNSIMILSQMLSENSGDMQMSEVVDYSRVIYAAGNDLLTLIDDILDLSKVEAGKIEIMTDEVNVTEIPQLMKLMFEPVADKKNLDFDVTLEPNVPNVILTDGQRLQQILKNLLSNAFKFTEQGSVTMKIALADPSRIKELLHRNPEETVLAISITDTGIGIPIDKQQIIFEAFQQVDGTTNRQYGGTGLGLSICREFTRLLGGSIVVKSEVHKGSTFTLYVPNARELEQEHGKDNYSQGEIAAASEELTEAANEAASIKPRAPIEQQADEPISSDAQLFEGKKVLLVDDDARNLYALVTALEMKGVTVDVADHGKHALELLRGQSDYDLVLMDIMMPTMGGYDAMKAIRGNLQMLDLPIIALTAKAMKSEKEKCLESGASDYITKPLNMDQLFSLMRVWLTKQVKP